MIVKTKEADLITYLEDSSNSSGEASWLYLPESKDELLVAVRESNRRNIPFTASCGRTGTSGGCIPKQGAIISLERLNQIIDIDPKTRTARLEAGVSLSQLETEANKLNLTLRASPTEPLALAGGIISTAASGVRGFGYSGIRNYVKEIELCLATAEVIKIRRGQIFAKGRVFDFELAKRRFKFKLPSYSMPNCKSQAGYFINPDMDIIDLFIGSEGTLGIISSCVLALQDMAYKVFDGLIFFAREEAALEFVSKIKDLKLKNMLNPAALEFFDTNSLDMLKKEYSFIPKNSTAVYFEQEAKDAAEYDKLIEQWQKLVEESGALIDQAILADTSKERERLFEIRHKLPQMVNEFLRQVSQVKVASDIAVPHKQFSRMYQYYKKVAGDSKLKFVNFGHIGESHLHFNFLPNDDSEAEKSRQYLEEIYRKAVSLGGTVSAEHGIGKIKKPYLKLMYNEQEIKQMAALKKYFDPDCLLGLDNIFDKELLTKP